VSAPVAYARGHVGAHEFAERPGLEPVWVRWLVEAGVLAGTTGARLREFDRLAENGGPAPATTPEGTVSTPGVAVYCPECRFYDAPHEHEDQAAEVNG